MNRVIKFRLWDVEHKEYFTEGFSVSIDGLFWYDDNGFVCRITPETYILEQFTGLHDKNGVECYEGDHDEEGTMIDFCPECSGYQFFLVDLPTKDVIFCNSCEGNYMLQDYISDFVITGNIHQTTTKSI